MIGITRVIGAPAAALCLLLLSSCASDGGYSGYGGADASVAVGYGYYGGGYYPYYPPGYGCCWYDDGGRPIEVPPPGNRPDRPTTLPAQPSQLPAQRPSQPSTRPAPSTRPSTGASRPAPRPTPAPRPMGGGGRRR
jgi:hypothetical protein